MARSGQRFRVCNSANRPPRRGLQLERLEERLPLAVLPANFSETLVASGVSNATAMEIAPNGDIWALEQSSGLVKRFRSGVTTADVVGSVAGLGMNSEGERGLLGIAFDPNYASNKFVYLYYTSTSGPVHNQISRFTVNDTSATDYLFVGTTGGGTSGTPTEFIVSALDPLSGATNHNGGAMHFGPDNMLYVAVGENANGAHAQTVANRHGKMLRINVNADDFPNNPGIPSDPNNFQNWGIPAGQPTTFTVPDGPDSGTAPDVVTSTGFNRAIWALGLRNPFTFAFQPGTGRMFINDVGQGTWEEINDGAAGANYGWPNTEGSFSQSNFPFFTQPLYAYDHGGAQPNGVAITGGAFYNPTTSQFPAQYVGDYFFSDFVGGDPVPDNPNIITGSWIFRLDYNPATGQFASAPVLFASNISLPVDLKADNAGNLYYLARGSGQVFRISFTGAPPSITDQPDSQTISQGGSVTFTVAASGEAPLTYQWQRADSGGAFANIAGATGTSFTQTNVPLSDNGDRFRVIVTDTFGSPTTSNVAVLTVTTNQAPSAAITITGGLRNGNWDAGTTANFSGSATDPEQGTLGASSFTWQVDYLTTIDGGDADGDSLPGITRPYLSPSQIGQVASSSFTPATTGPYTLTNVAHVITLTVTDAQGLTDVERLIINPNAVTLTVTTDPAGLEVTVDGQPFAAPRTFASVVGFERPIGAAATQSSGGTTYNFDSWRHGGAATQTLITPAGNTTYTATYAAAPAPVVRVIDNGSPGFSTVGNWQVWNQSGYTGDFHYMTSVNASGSATATWDFGSVTPGMYRVSANWVVSTSRPNNAPYTVFDGSLAEATVPIDQRVAPNDFSADGGTWENLGVFQIDSGVLRVVLSNAASQPNVVADGVRIERIGELPAPAPEITVLAGETAGAPNLPDGGAFSFGNVAQGSPQTQTFTVRNVGSQDLTLGSFDSMPNGFGLAQGFGHTTLIPGQTTTFAIRAEATATGTFSGVVRFTNNDGDENPFDFTVSATVAVPPVVRVIDNGSPGFSTVGNWQVWNQSGYTGDFHYMTSVNASGSATATWDFGSVTPGMYRVSANWVVSTSRPNNAPYTVFDGSLAEATVPIDQRVAPNDFSADGGTWENLGVFQIDSGVLRVVLSNAASQPNVVADGVRIERIGELPAPAPEITVLAGETAGAPNLPDGGAFSFGNVAQGSPQTQTFTVRNVGSQDLTLGSFDSMPNGFGLAQGFGHTTLIPGQTTTFAIRAEATATGTFSGVVRFTNNDGDENPFDFTVSATVAVPPVVRVIDNGSPGFSTVGNWQVWNQSGYTGDFHYMTSVNASGSATATWDFGSVTPGMYRVSANWVVSTSRPNNAPYTVFDGSLAEATVPIDQRVAPNDFSADGGTWENLGVFQIDSGMLRVVLSNAASQPNVVADGVRIERIGELPGAAAFAAMVGEPDDPQSPASLRIAEDEFAATTTAAPMASDVALAMFPAVAPLDHPLAATAIQNHRRWQALDIDRLFALLASDEWESV